MRLAQTLLIAAIGAILGWAVSLPLPFLLGPMFSCLFAALCGLKLGNASPLGDLMRTILGVAVGASITPALIGRLPDMALSLALIPAFLLAIGLVGYPYFKTVCRFDPATSYYGAMPGGLQDMLIFGEEAGGNVRILGLLHATRVLLIVSAMPFLLQASFELDLTRAPGQPAVETPIHELLIMAVCAIAGWRIARQIGLFGASILGPMILSAAASLSGLIHFRPPAEAIIAAQFFIGLGVGTKYTGITWSEVQKVLLSALGYCILIGGISFVAAETVILLGLAPAAAALMAFSPGGQAEMAVLAIVAGIDVAFVVAHHMTRLILVITISPLIARKLGIT